MIVNNLLVNNNNFKSFNNNFINLIITIVSHLDGLQVFFSALLHILMIAHMILTGQKQAKLWKDSKPVYARTACRSGRILKYFQMTSAVSEP